MKLINTPGDLYNDRRLNIRISSADFDRLRRIKQARLIASDSEVVRTLIDQEHEILQEAGAFRTIDRLAQQTARAKPRKKRRKKAKRK